MPKRQQQRIGCYAVMIEDGKLLACRLCDGLSHHGRWTLPGGGNEFGESIEETLVREVFEETGLVIQPKSLLRTGSRVTNFTDVDLHHLQFLFSVEIVSGNLRNEERGSTDLVEWIPLTELDAENSVDIVLMAVGLA